MRALIGQMALCLYKTTGLRFARWSASSKSFMEAREWNGEESAISSAEVRGENDECADT
jgi:hypothetical protein